MTEGKGKGKRRLDQIYPHIVNELQDNSRKDGKELLISKLISLTSQYDQTKRDKEVKIPITEEDAIIKRVSKIIKDDCLLLLRKFNMFNEWIETDISKLKKYTKNENNTSIETLMIELITNVPNVDERNNEKQLVHLLL